MDQQQLAGGVVLVVQRDRVSGSAAVGRWRGACSTERQGEWISSSWQVA